jgi:hypothetical protein
MTISSDWLSRVTIPDMYPRTDDPFRPSAGAVPPGTPMAQGELPSPISVSLTQPGTRPNVIQRASQFAFTTAVAPAAIVANRLEVDAITICNPSTNATSVFVGFGSGVSTTSGLEIVPGVPLTITQDNQREQWELQRVLEFMAALMAVSQGATGLPPYKSPRVVLDASNWFIVAASALPISIMLWFIPEQQ